MSTYNLDICAAKNGSFRWSNCVNECLCVVMKETACEVLIDGSLHGAVLIYCGRDAFHHLRAHPLRQHRNCSAVGTHSGVNNQSRQHFGKLLPEETT